MTVPTGSFNAHDLGVGGWVVRSDGAVLLVRMTYGPADGRLMIPGGHSDDGEMLDATAVREVREETGVETVPRGILLVRQRFDAIRRDLYLVFLMNPVEASPVAVPDGVEISETVWLTPAEILTREDIQPIARELAAAWLGAPGTCLAERHLTWQSSEAYRLWAGAPGRPDAG